MGVIDSLSKGFQTVYRHWWLILIPIVLDTFLWLGPRASVDHLLQQTLEALETESADIPSEDVAEWMDTFGATLRDVASRYNTFSMLRVGALGVPSLVIWGGARLGSPSAYEALWVYFLGATNMPDLLVSVSDAEFIDVLKWQIDREGSWLLLSILLTAAGIFIGCTYLTFISCSLNDQDPWPFWPRVLKLGGRFVLFWVLRVVVLIMMGVPFLLVFWVLSVVSVGLALLFGTVVLGMATWLSFYGIFFVAALVMNDTSVWHALWNSISVVLRNFWSTLWLFILVNLIGGGLTILWQQLSTGAWWTWIAIVGNAYIGTSLVTASLVFYQDRYTRWREALAKLLSGNHKQPT